MPALAIEQFSPVSLFCFLFFAALGVFAIIIRNPARVRRFASTLRKAVSGFFAGRDSGNENRRP